MGSPPLSHMAPRHQHQPHYTAMATSQILATMSYQEALKHLKDPFVVETIEERHITLSWKEAGRVSDVVQKEVDKSLGQYRNSIRAVPLAIRNVRLKAPCYVIEDHPCMHLDIVVKMIAFKIPKDRKERQKRPLRCTAAHVTETSVVAWLYGGLISVIHTPGIPNLKAGDEFECQMVDFHYRGGLVQLQTTAIRAGKRKRRGEDEEAKLEPLVPTPGNKKKKRGRSGSKQPPAGDVKDEPMEFDEG